MQARERDLGRPGEVEVVALDVVDVDLVRREEAGAVHRLLADEHGRKDRHEPLRGHALEREAVDRELEQRGGADPVGEARAGEARAALHVDARELEVVLGIGDLGRLANAAQLDGVLLLEAVRRGGIGRVRNAIEELGPPPLRVAELRLRAAGGPP